MSKMFKLMENELDTVFASLSYTRACIKNVETLADYILENDDKANYTEEMINIAEKLSQDMFNLNLKIESNQELIEGIKKKITKLY